jgi:hypothetical protein
MGISLPLSASSQSTGAQALTMSLTNRSRMMRGPHRDIRHLPDLYSSLPRQRDRMDRLLESAAATGTRSF